MTENLDRLQQFAKHLARFTDLTAAIWQAYQSAGPGRVDPQLFDGVDTPYHTLMEMLQQDELLTNLASLNIEPAELQSALKTARELAHRCACTPAGLCFVTGEAGLIPRKDLQKQFALSLESCSQIGAMLDRLGGTP